MFKEGDKYIHFTKYGGVNKGEVKWYGETICLDIRNGVSYKQPYIVTTKGISLMLDGTDGRVFKVNEEFTEEQCKNIENNLKRISDLKKEKRTQMLEKYNQNREGVEL